MVFCMTRLRLWYRYSRNSMIWLAVAGGLMGGMIGVVGFDILSWQFWALMGAVGFLEVVALSYRR